MSKRSLTVGCVLRPGSEALEVLPQVMAAAPAGTRFCLEEAGHHAVAELPEGVDRVPAKQLAAESDLVVVLGGDGTLIHASSLLPDRVVPILGINLGFLGMLTEVTREEVAECVPKALAGELPHSDRMRLDAEIWRDDICLHRGRILNDVVIAREAMARLASLRISLGEEMVTSLRGDGVILSTPTGSTAYAMAAGGSIVSGRLEAIAITPVCPQQLSMRQLVVQPGEITVALHSDSAVYATLDGKVGQPLQTGDRVVVRPAPVPARILYVPWRNDFQTLRAKLRWGAE